MTSTLEKLQEAEQKAIELLTKVEQKGLIKAGQTEKELNEAIFKLAHELFGIEKYWHKRIVRAGKNTLAPYDENPPNLIIQKEDILFLDFGPIFEDYEADIGRTYVLGNDPLKIKIKEDIEKAWYQIKAWFETQEHITGAALYQKAVATAEAMGWEYGIEIAGHLVGQFPHEKLEKGNYGLYVHPENPNNMRTLDAQGKPRHWILELHFIDRKNEIGSFFEQLLV